MSWRVCKALGATGVLGLLGEVNAYAPHRSKLSDGSIGDVRHQGIRSDHNPCPCHGVVCARDFTHDSANGFDARKFAEWLRNRVLSGERRIKYVISERLIFSGHGQKNKPGLWRPYTGSNPHIKHVHVSIRHPDRLFDDDRPWGWKG